MERHEHLNEVFKYHQAFTYGPLKDYRKQIKTKLGSIRPERIDFKQLMNADPPIKAPLYIYNEEEPLSTKMSIDQYLSVYDNQENMLAHSIEYLKKFPEEYEYLQNQVNRIGGKIEFVSGEKCDISNTNQRTLKKIMKDLHPTDFLTTEEYIENAIVESIKKIFRDSHCIGNDAIDERDSTPLQLQKLAVQSSVINEKGRRILRGPLGIDDLLDKLHRKTLSGSFTFQDWQHINRSCQIADNKKIILWKTSEELKFLHSKLNDDGEYNPLNVRAKLMYTYIEQLLVDCGCANSGSNTRSIEQVRYDLFSKLEVIEKGFTNTAQVLKPGMIPFERFTRRFAKFDITKLDTEDKMQEIYKEVLFYYHSIKERENVITRYDLTITISPIIEDIYLSFTGTNQDEDAINVPQNTGTITKYMEDYLKELNVNIKNSLDNNSLKTKFYKGLEDYGKYRNIISAGAYTIAYDESNSCVVYPATAKINDVKDTVKGNDIALDNGTIKWENTDGFTEVSSTNCENGQLDDLTKVYEDLERVIYNVAAAARMETYNLREKIYDLNIIS